MKRFLVLLAALLLVVTPVLADGAYGPYGYDVGEVISRNASLRVSPNTSAELIVSIKNGQSFTILDANDNWYQVNFEGQVGWIRKRFVIENPIHLVARSGGDLYANPSLTNKLVGTYNRYERFTVIASTRDYYLISCRNATAYVSRTADFWTDEDLSFLSNVIDLRTTSGKSNLYLTSSTNTRVGSIAANTVVEVLGYVDDYAIIKYETAYAFIPVDSLK